MKVKASMVMSDEAKEALDAQKQVNKLLRKFRYAVTDLYDQIHKTSPVDTGYYKAGWGGRPEFSADGREAEIWNPVNYAEYLIYGTRKIEGSLSFGRASYSKKAIALRAKRYPRADLSRGILHDVRAIVYEWEQKAAELLAKDEE
jgi:hypothetical protein